MALTTSPLARQLQDARLGPLLPILQRLGVECSEDLQFLEDDDIAKHGDITVIQKRRFFDWIQEWRAKVLEGGPEVISASSSQSGDELLQCTQENYSQLLQEDQIQCRSPRKERASAPPAPVQNSVWCKPQTFNLKTPPRSLCGGAGGSSSSSTAIAVPQLVGVPLAMAKAMPDPLATSRTVQATPRTMTARKSFADTPIEVLRELERLDMALQEELERTTELEAELEEERERFSRIADEKRVNEENHARDISMLEQLIQHTLTENELLKSTVQAWETTKTDHGAASDTKSQNSCVTDSLSQIRMPQTARESSARDSMDEPEMEPRRTMQASSPFVSIGSANWPQDGITPSSPFVSIGSANWPQDGTTPGSPEAPIIWTTPTTRPSVAPSIRPSCEPRRTLLSDLTTTGSPAAPMVRPSCGVGARRTTEATCSGPACPIGRSTCSGRSSHLASPDVTERYLANSLTCSPEFHTGSS